MTGIRSLVPMAHVADVERSMAFYGRLGFRVRHTFTPDGSNAPSWAWLESEGASLMVARASDPLGEPQGVLFYFYLYADDVGGLRTSIEQSGLAPGPIAFPFYAPRGEFRVTDPDGYVLMITHT